MIFFPSRISDPGVKKAPDPGYATLTHIVFYIGVAGPHSLNNGSESSIFTPMRIRARIQEAN